MQTREFFKLVLPDEGYLIVATLFPIPNTKKFGWWNKVVDDIPQLQVQATTWKDEKRDVYFALASYEEKEVWNPDKKNYKTGTMGRMEKRTQANAKLLRALFLDLDVGPNTETKKKYQDQSEAVKALRDFCNTLHLPKPILVNSGYGIHVYWPLDTNVPKERWKLVAEKLKHACIAYGLLQDHNVTADEARVLRVPGTVNFKGQTERPVVVLNDARPHPLAAIEVKLDQYLVGKTLPKTATRPAAPIPGTPTLPAGVQGNIGATNDPLNANRIVFNCAAMARLVADRGATATYPQWVLGLSVARYCENPHQMMLAVSDGHADFDLTQTKEKFETLNGGPPTCAKFWEEDNATCEGCPHWRKVKTPASVGREPRSTPPDVAAPAEGFKLPAPPPPYMIIDSPYDKGSKCVIQREKGDDEDFVDHLVMPYQLYPKAIIEQNDEENEADERSLWVVRLPRSGDREFKMPQSILSDARKLHGFMLSRGMHITTKQSKLTQNYMTAYLHELAKAADRDRMYERLGWHNHHQTFVTPTMIYHRDGTETPHVASKVIEAVTKGALHARGTLEGWKKHMEFYAGPQYPASRTFIYAAFGAELLHMTTHKGVLFAASGDTGRGKTTTLEAGASIFGDPTGLLVGGGKDGTTINALYSILGSYHSMPLFWDDTTERDADEMRKFMLNISNGRGKERMHGNVHDGKVVTWETIVLSSANTDDVHRVMSSGKDSTPHLMRFVSVPFDTLDRSTEAKLRADAFKRGIRENYGHAGPIYFKYITVNYEAVNELVLKYMEKFDRKLNVTSDERQWSAALASLYVGGLIAHKLGLIPFTPKDDLQWLLDHFTNMRSTYQQAAMSSADILSEFLEECSPNTLTLSAKAASNVDNIVEKPRGALYIRNEVDTGFIFIAQQAFNNYCTEQKANFRTIEAELIQSKVILRRQCYKVLGANTPFAKAQTRCWQIDRNALASIKGGKK